MSKSGIRSSASPASSTHATAVTPIQFIGISLSGGKADRAVICVLEYFKDQKRLFLTKVFDRLKTEESISADLKIHEILSQYRKKESKFGVDVPLRVPVCLRCELKCPGYELCDVEEVKWLKSFYKNINKGKKPKKMPTPYTQRPLDAHLSHGLDMAFEVSHALGANAAPLLARAHFISRRLEVNFFEVNTRVSVWRIGNRLKLNKSNLKKHRNSVGGEQTRQQFLAGLISAKSLFVYHQDQKILIDSYHAFDAFIVALTMFYDFQNLSEEKPADFPADADWGVIPKL